MSTEDRVATLEVDMNEVKTLLASAARHAENAAAVADRNAIAIQDNHQDVVRLTERIDRLTASEESSRQRLDEFVFQAQRLLSDHGGRLERLEASMETALSLCQANTVAIGNLSAATTSLTASLTGVAAQVTSLAGEVRSLVAGVDRLENIVANHLKREHGQGEQEET
ncbi:MAG TPA: hypothetical protein V6D29_23730 [Leptolyngbyaceae cyanobacterium]